MILAIDTSAGQCAIALVGERTFVDSKAMTRGHAEALFPMIEGVLARAGATSKDISRIAVCTGPGSFTGVRVGISAVRGLALALNIPAIGISRFDALHAESGGNEIRLPAPKSTVYVQSYSNGVADGAPRRENGDADDKLANPEVLAHLAAERAPGERPAPLYLRGADATPSRDVAPVLLDG